MAMGRQKDGQGDLMVSWSEMPRSPGHVFYDRLQAVLIEGGFDAFAEASCRPYSTRPGWARPRCRPGAISGCTWWATSRASTASAVWSGAARTRFRCGPVGWGITKSTRRSNRDTTFGGATSRRGSSRATRPAYAPTRGSTNGCRSLPATERPDGRPRLVVLVAQPLAAVHLVPRRRGPQDHPDIDVEEVSSEHAGRAAPA